MVSLRICTKKNKIIILEPYSLPQTGLESYLTSLLTKESSRTGDGNTQSKSLGASLPGAAVGCVKHSCPPHKPLLGSISSCSMLVMCKIDFADTLAKALTRLSLEVVICMQNLTCLKYLHRLNKDPPLKRDVSDQCGDHLPCDSGKLGRQASVQIEQEKS